MSLLALASTTLGLGFLHGLGADHLMAIAALALRGKPHERRARVVQTACGFALGHTLVLGAGALVAVTFGVVLPAAVESGAERVGGALLIVFGVIGLWGVAAGRAFSHVHRENDGGTRWHLHVGSPAHPHGQSRLATIMGAAFAISSLRALMLLEPFGANALGMAVPAVLLLILLFGAGTLLSMSLFGVLLARALSLGAIRRLGQVAAVFVALASMLLGIYWMLA